MTLDVEFHLGAVERSVTVLERDGKPARAVTLTRFYDTDIDDLWDALTNPERLPCWFLPVEGDLQPGARPTLQRAPSRSKLAPRRNARATFIPATRHRMIDACRRLTS